MGNRVVVGGVASLVLALVTCLVAAGTQEPPVTPPDTSSPKAEQSDGTNVNLTGTVVDQDGAPWEGLQVVLVPWDAAKKEGSIFFYPDDKGMTQLGNPHATTDDAGRFTITVSRAYLENEGPEFRIEYMKGGFGHAEWRALSVSHTHPQEPTVLKAGKVGNDVATIDVGEFW